MPKPMTTPELIGRMSALLDLGPGVPSNFWPTGVTVGNGAMQDPIRRILEPLMLWQTAVPLSGRKLPPQQRAAYQRAGAVLEEGVGVELRSLTLSEETAAMQAFYQERGVVQLRAARIAGGYTQAQAAARCGVSARAYEAWERAEARIPVGALEALEGRPTLN